MHGVIRAVADLSTQDKLEVIELLWLAFAANARTEQLAIPGGFQEEQARQVERLDKFAALIRADAPDLECERLWLEDDLEGMVEHLKRRVAEEGSGGQVGGQSE
jgi:hypothetical protein